MPSLRAGQQKALDRGKQRGKLDRARRSKTRPCDHRASAEAEFDAWFMATVGDDEGALARFRALDFDAVVRATFTAAVSPAERLRWLAIAGEEKLIGAQSAWPAVDRVYAEVVRLAPDDVENFVSRALSAIALHDDAPVVLQPRIVHVAREAAARPPRTRSRRRRRRLLSATCGDGPAARSAARTVAGVARKASRRIFVDASPARASRDHAPRMNRVRMVARFATNRRNDASMPRYESRSSTTARIFSSTRRDTCASNVPRASAAGARVNGVGSSWSNG